MDDDEFDQLFGSSPSPPKTNPAPASGSLSADKDAAASARLAGWASFVRSATAAPTCALDVAAASRNVLEHCSEDDRARLLSSVTTPLQEDQEFIPELNVETHQLADKVVEQAIATIAILIAKKCSISILKKDD